MQMTFLEALVESLTLAAILTRAVTHVAAYGLWLTVDIVMADEATLAYIEALDAERDLAILAQHGLGIRPECARVLRVLTALLKKAAARGMSPFDIGSIMCRWVPPAVL